jgi:photosystem II stability/assembly factor-like uncharacterized protein
MTADLKCRYFFHETAHGDGKIMRLKSLTLVLTVTTIGLGVTGCSRGTAWSDLGAEKSQRIYRISLGNAVSPDLTGVWSSENGQHVSILSLEGLRAHSDDWGEHWKEDAFESVASDFILTGCCDHKKLWVPGMRGEVRLSEDGGATWRIVTAGTDRDLNSLAVTRDGLDLWAVGEKGTIVHSSDGGNSWTTQISTIEKTLKSVWSSLDGDQVWAVGAGGVVLHTRNRGAKWALLSSASFAGVDLSAVVGEPDGKSLWIAAPGENDTRLIHSSDGGETWRLFEQPGVRMPSTLFVSTKTGDLNGIVSNDLGGSNGSHIVRYDKVSKKWHSIFDSPDIWLRGIWSSDDGRRLWAVGNNGAVIKSSDGGVSWVTVKLGFLGKGDLFANFSSTVFSAVSSSDGHELYSVASNGVFHSTNGGKDWTREDLSALDYAKFTEWGVNPTSIWATADLTKVWITTDTGLVLHRDKSTGGTWIAQITEQDAGLLAITGTSDGEELWCVTKKGSVFHSTDEGLHWKRQFERQDSRLNTIWLASAGNQLWVAGDDGLVLYSVDRGWQWQKQDSKTKKDLRTIWGSQGQLWVAGSEGTIISSRDGGSHWEPRETPTSDDLLAFWGNSQAIFALGSSGTDTGVLLESLDKGESWVSQQINFPVTSGGGLQWSDNNHVSSFWTGTSSPDTFRINTLNGFAPSVSQYRFDSDLNKIYLDIRLTGLGAEDLSRIHGRLYGSSEYGHSQGQNELIAYSKTTSDPAMLSFSFDPAKALGAQSGQKVYSDVFITMDGTGRDYDLPPYIFDRWGGLKRHSKLLSVAAFPLLLVLFLCLSLLLKPILLYRIFSGTRIYAVVDTIPNSLGGNVIKSALKLTLVPLFVTHTRTLDAWVSEKSERWRHQFTTETRGIGAQSYVALPLEIRDEGSTQFLKEPLARDLSVFFRTEVSFFQIVGPGGVGKTTLALRIAQMALNPTEEGLFGWVALPILVQDEVGDLFESVRKTVEFYVHDDIDQEFLRALIRKRRIMLIVDRFSERSINTQSAIKEGVIALRPGSLILTTRSETELRGARGMTIKPLALDSGTLLFFMTQLLQSSSENTAFSSIRDQIDLAERLSRLLLLGDHRREVPVTPLLARLYIEKAIRLVRSQRSLDYLPSSIPDAYFDFLRDLNPKDPSIANRLTDEQMLRIAGTIAEAALKPDWVPKEIPRLIVRRLTKTGDFDVQEDVDILQRFIDNGVLIGSYAGAEEMVRFALDPVCECLGAFRYATEATSDSTRRAEMQARLDTNGTAESGFDLALRLIVAAYGARFGWTDYPVMQKSTSSGEVPGATHN